jgi:diguanylate cyclase (GGDEF)-like protein
MSESSARCDSHKLLVVDDNENSRDLLSRRLGGCGYAVEVAESGAAALEKINRAQYDLILLDQIMPGMSGLDLLRLLRATYSQSELPVIMVTAVNSSQTMVDALEQGANDYVVKPVDLPVVTARIQSQLARSDADRQSKVRDSLTGLGNRNFFLSRLAEALARRDDALPPPLAVLLIDLDGFKPLNDSFGHPAGDRILIEAANRFQEVLSNLGISHSPPLARIGADEFAVLLDPAVPAGYAEEVAKALLACLALPFAVQGSLVSMTASLGIALSRDSKAAANELLRDADLAMVRARELGRNRSQLFSPAMHERARVRMGMEIDLGRAVEREQLAVFYQPKIRLATRSVIGFEALLRWRHSVYGLLPPSDFIPIAEETGLILPLGEWILREACTQLKTWQDRFPCSPPLSMNVNLSVKQLADPRLVSIVESALAETGIPPETLHLELTESSLASEIESAREVLSHLKALRVRLKLDDFGTGYSSLSHLRTLHFDSLKIDRSFINRLASDPESHAIVATILNLARSLRMTVVAEGIESEDQLARLIDLGCPTGQGFLFSEPVAADVAERMLASAHAVQQHLANAAAPRFRGSESILKACSSLRCEPAPATQRRPSSSATASLGLPGESWPTT